MTNYMINYMINYDKLLYDKLLTGLISTGALAGFLVAINIHHDFTSAT